jgi:hypothetical protein
MTFVDALTAVLDVCAVLSWVVTALLVKGAIQRPFIVALGLMALLSLLVSAGLTAYAWAIANAALSYPIPREIAQVVLRVVFLGLFAFQVLFLIAYRRRWFRDRGAS